MMLTRWLETKSAIAPTRKTLLRMDWLEARENPSLTIQFDYSYDSSHFFDQQSRRDILQLAANNLASRIDTTLGAIAPNVGAGNTWTLTTFNPSNPFDLLTLAALAVLLLLLGLFLFFSFFLLAVVVAAGAVLIVAPALHLSSLLGLRSSLLLVERGQARDLLHGGYLQGQLLGREELRQGRVVRGGFALLPARGGGSTRSARRVAVG